MDYPPSPVPSNHSLIHNPDDAQSLDTSHTSLSYMPSTSGSRSRSHDPDNSHSLNRTPTYSTGTYAYSRSHNSTAGSARSRDPTYSQSLNRTPTYSTYAHTRTHTAPSISDIPTPSSQSSATLTTRRRSATVNNPDDEYELDSVAALKSRKQDTVLSYDRAGPSSYDRNPVVHMDSGVRLNWDDLPPQDDSVSELPPMYTPQ